MRSGINLVPKEVVLRQSTVPLIAGSALIPANAPNFYWNLDQPVSREARHLFSLNTCNGCHGGETGCWDGMHIRPRDEGGAACLSSFLHTTQQPLYVDDPAVKGAKFAYHEMNDRAAILAALLEPSDRATINALHPILRSRLNRAQYQ